jgi:hypothetical protein
MWLHFIRTLNYECAFCYLHVGGGGGGVKYNCVILKGGPTKFQHVIFHFHLPPPVINDWSLTIPNAFHDGSSLEDHSTSATIYQTTKACYCCL